jgi:predicted RNase H-like nuclease (RuvC/YqgF family)
LEKSQDQNPAGESGTLALSVDDFSSLEDRILRAVNLVKRERLARAAAEERAAQAEARLRDQTPVIEQLQKEAATLHAERDQVRQRVERLLSQLDALEL